MKTKQKWKGLLFGLMMCLLFGMTAGTVKAEAAGEVINITSVKITVPRPEEKKPFTIDPGTVKIETVPANACVLSTVRENPAYWNGTGGGATKQEMMYGYQYTSHFYLEPKPGFTFPDGNDGVFDGQVAVNGWTVSGFVKTTTAGNSKELFVTGKWQAAESAKVREVNITGVKAVTGQYCTADNIKIESVPADSVSKNWNYAWYDVTAERYCDKTDVFQNDHRYKLEVTVQAINGYCFTDKEYTYFIGRARMNGGPAEFKSLSGTSMVISERFRPESAEVTTVIVNGFQAPVEGQLVSDNLSGINTAVSEIKSIKWWDYTELRYLEETEKFKGGHIYRLEAVLNAKEGVTYGFQPDVLLNNDVNLVDPYTVGFSKTEIEFSSIEFSLPISAVNITGYKVPIVGQTAGENLEGTGPDEKSFSNIVKLSWWDDRNQTYMKPDTHFLAGRTYRLEVVLEPMKGGYYRNQVPCSINGDSSPVDPYTLAREARNVEFATERIKVEPLATPVLDKVENTADGVKLTWKSVENAKCYSILRRAPGEDNLTVLADTDQNIYVDRNVEDGVNYTYSLLCVIPGTHTFISGYDQEGRSITYKKPDFLFAAPVIENVSCMELGVKIFWNKSYFDGYTYEILRKEGEGNWEHLSFYESPRGRDSDSFIDSSVEEGGTYTYTFRIVSPKGSAIWSDYDPVGKTITYKKPVVKLETPAITKLENAATGVKATWDAVQGAEMYRLMYKEPGGSWVTGGYTTGTSYTVKKLSSGVEYFFTVRCMTADKKTNTSDYDKEGTSITYIAAPVLQKVENASNGVKVTWDLSAGAEQYKVMYKEPGGSYKTAGYTTSNTYTVTGLTAGTEYTFTARCMTADKKTYTSSYDSKGLTLVYQPAAAKLATPVITKLENASTGVKATWDAVEGAEMYRLMYKEPGGSFVTGGYTTGTSYTVKNLTSGVEYYFTVRCMTADKKTNTSDYDRVGTPITYIAAPALKSVENTANGVKVTWDLSAGAELYKVMYKEPGGSYKTAGYTAENNYTVTGLTAGVEYTFTARCIMADKKTYTSSYDSKGLTLVYQPTATKLATPVITKLENTASGVKVTWGAVEGAEMYRLMYKEPDGSFKTGGYTTGTSYTVKDVTGGVTYAFTVRCMTADKKTNTSDYDKVGTSITYIAAPVLTKVYNTASGVKVTWQASAGAELYKVMYMGPDGTWKTGGYSTSTGYTVKNLTEGTAYAFTVRCMTADKSAYTSGYDRTGLSITYVKP